jgi:predicted PurR-regulated permease PerM
MRAEGLLWFVRGIGLALGAVIVLALATGAMQATRVLVLILLSILLAAGLEPVIGWIRGRTHLSRSAAVLVVYVCFFVLVSGVLFLVVPAAIGQLNELGVRLPPLMDEVRTWARDLRPPAVGESVIGIANLIERTLVPGRGTSPEPEAIIEAGVAIADILIQVITALTLIFFWLTGHQRMQRFVLALIPATRRANAREGWNEVESRLGLWVRGQIVLMGTMFAMTSVAYVVLGLEGALLLGVIAGVAEAIPLVGPAIGAVPALVVAALTGRIELVLAVAIVFVIIQVIEGNILVPLVMRNTVGVPPFLVLASIVIGAAIAGLVGALLAVPLTAALVVVLERLQARGSRVQLESAGAAETPAQSQAEEIGRTLPDARGSSAAR